METKKIPHDALRIATPDRKSKKPLNFPVSPTDGIVSPVSRKLYNLRSRPSPGKYCISSAVFPTKYPGKHIKMILGSSSIGRKQIVDSLEWNYERMSPDIDEKSIRSEDPLEMPLKIALAKAEALMNRLKSIQSKEPAIIVCADTIALYKDTVREKPETEENTQKYLSSYSHNDVSTITAVVVTHYPSGIQGHGVDVATVHWGELNNTTINKVIAKGQVLNAAGGFTIEDYDLSKCVSSITGTVDSIIGLPVALVERLIIEVVNKVSVTNGGCNSDAQVSV